MKYSILSVLVGSLILVGCGGGDDKKNTQSDTPKPIQPQPDANTAVITLGSNNNIVSLSNVAQATFSTEDAKNNPVITIQKAQDKDLIESFNWAKQILDIENSSDYEVTLTSSKPLGSTVDMELNVPSELVRALNDQNALAAYIVTTIDDDDSEQDFSPITSTYNPETQKLLVTLPDWALQAGGENKSVHVTMKIGLAKAVTDEPATPVIAMARMLTLPSEGESVQETQNQPKLICPVKEIICTETSRYGARKPGTVGKGKTHKGIDFRATSANSLIAADAGTIIRINEEDGSLALRLNSGQSTLVYRHMSKINKKVGDRVAAGDMLGNAGKKGVTFEHLHLELIDHNGMAVCRGSDDQHITCNAKIPAPIDSFPYFVNSVKLVKTSAQDTSITVGQAFNLELRGFDKNGKRITTEIDNRFKASSASVDADGTPILDPEKKLGGIKIQPQGSLRSVNWSVNPASAYKVESDAKMTPDSILGYVTTDKDKPAKRSSATVTVNQEKPATITAYWDGLENLKASYDIGNHKKFYVINYKVDICTAPDAWGTDGEAAACSLGGWGFGSASEGKLYIKENSDDVINLVHNFMINKGTSDWYVNYNIPKIDKNTKSIIINGERHFDDVVNLCLSSSESRYIECKLNGKTEKISAEFIVKKRDDQGEILGGEYNMVFPYVRVMYKNYGSYTYTIGYEYATGHVSGSWKALDSKIFPLVPSEMIGCVSGMAKILEVYLQVYAGNKIDYNQKCNIGYESV